VGALFFLFRIKSESYPFLLKHPNLKQFNTLSLPAGTGVDIFIWILNLGIHTGSSIRVSHLGHGWPAISWQGLAGGRGTT